MWSWNTDRRATRAHIRHFVAEAVAQKVWAQGVDAKWRKRASNMSLEMLDDRLTKSVRTLARESLDYARHRAFMPGAYIGYPGDRPAYELWQALSTGTPVTYYDTSSGKYVTAKGGAAK